MKFPWSTTLLAATIIVAAIFPAITRWVSLLFIGYVIYLAFKHDLSLRSMVSDMLGYQYHYRVQFTYRTETHSYQFTATISTMHPCIFRKFRDLKKKCGPWAIKQVPKHLLNNGTLEIEPKMYLGYW